MTGADIEITMQGAKEKFTEARPRIISDNGPQFKRLPEQRHGDLTPKDMLARRQQEIHAGTGPEVGDGPETTEALEA